MAEQPTDGGSFPQDRYQHPETALGGADAVEKTSYVIGSGTTPEGKTPPIAGVTARTPSGGGINVLAWAIGGVAALIGLVYVLGIIR